MGAAATGNLGLSACEEVRKISVSDSSPDFKHGHLLRNAQSMKPSNQLKTDVLVIGGGIAGLSAARRLSQASDFKITVVELESKLGGNSSSGANEISDYPLGAHYLPLPNPDNLELIEFLQNHEILKIDGDRKFWFAEEALCAEPSERLYKTGSWQSGILPKGNPELMRQYQHFSNKIDSFKRAVGSDGKPAFTIPIQKASHDPIFRELDTLSFSDWLKQQNLTHQELLWYLNYCTSDDYGTSLEETSAWAGILYFAGRKGTAENAEEGTQLTWAEGNNALVKLLKKDCKADFKTGFLAFKMEVQGDEVSTLVLDVKSGVTTEIQSNYVICAAPAFIANRIIPTDNKLIEPDYAPWIVANLTVETAMFEQRGFGVSWDNVIYGAKGLGYVNARHQNLEFSANQTVITYYRPLTEGSESNNRKRLLEGTSDFWKDEILADLKLAHPHIEQFTSHIEIHKWGHAMAKPKVGFLKNIQQNHERISGKVAWCHSDNSGISIFEEAFYQGISAANCILKHG